MILVSPNCIELNDFKKSYDDPCILGIFIEFSWFQKRSFMSFQRVKLWVEFSIWIWYSKIIIDVFKEISSSLWGLWDFYEFSSKAWVIENLLRLWVLRCDAYFHTLSWGWIITMSYVTFESWYELFLWVEYYEYLSYELLLLCIVLSLFVGCWHST